MPVSFIALIGFQENILTQRLILASLPSSRLSLAELQVDAMLNSSTKYSDSPRDAAHFPRKTMFLFRLISICLLQMQINNVTAFTGLFPERGCLFNLRPGLQLEAFQVSPFLRYRDTESSKEVLPDIDPSDLQETSMSASSNTHRDAHRSRQSTNLIRAIWLNQGAILLFGTALATVATFASSGEVGLSSLHWNVGSDFHSFFDWNVNEHRLFEGIMSTVPLLALGTIVEKSDRREASQVNFSTINMVISLFGRRKSSRDPEATSSSFAMLSAALIALSTGISEEIFFRGYVPTAIESFTDSWLVALIAQAALFSLAHISPKSSAGENKVVGGLQFANGLWYGVVYAASGGDILPCIIAHALYDMHILCETWCSINRQMDYTQDAFQQNLDAKETDALTMIQIQAGPSLNNDTLNLARRFFYAFDYEHKGSLCLHDVYRAIDYAFLQDCTIPTQEEVELIFDHVINGRDASLDFPGDRLTVSEFLRLLFTLKSKGAMQF